MRRAVFVSFALLSCTQQQQQPPPCLPELAAPQQVITLEERSAFAPDVFRGEDGVLRAYVQSVIFGDGAVYLSTSSDGLSWSPAARVLDQEHSFGDFGVLDPFVFVKDGKYTALYSSFLNEEPFWVFGLADSDDGVAWTKSHIAYSGSNDVDANGNGLDTQEMHAPKVWFDGATYHLYYLGYGDRIGPDGGPATSIGHAVSSDGLTYSFDSWVFAASDCGEGEPASSLRLISFGRSACPACELSEVLMIAEGNLCGGTSSMHLLRSRDGVLFDAPLVIPGRPGPGTLLLDGDRGIAYLGDYSDESAVTAEPVLLPTESSCRP